MIFKPFQFLAPNSNESKANPHLPHKLFQSYSSMRLIRTNFNPFQSVSPIRMNPKQIRTQISILFNHN